MWELNYFKCLEFIAPITRLNELLPITPESIFLCPNGQTDLTSASRNSRFYEDCLPPEFLSGVSFNNDQLEKVCEVLKNI